MKEESTYGLIEENKLLTSAPAPDFSKKERILMIATFLMLGNASLIMWNCLLNLLPSLLKTLYTNSGSFTDTVTAVYCTSLCVVSLVLTFYPVTKTIYVQCSLFFLYLLTVSFIMVCHFADESIVPLLLHLYAGVSGFFTTIVMSGAFSIAATIEKTCLSSASIGMGLSGLSTAVVWIFFSYAVFSRTVESTLLAVTLFMVFGGLIIATAFFLLLAFNNTDGVIKLLGIKHKKRFHIAHDFKYLRQTTIPDKITWATHKRVVSLSYKSIAARGLVFLETLLIFPTIGPVAWNETKVLQDINIVLFQFFDFGGRYSTELFPKINLSETNLLIALGIRCILVVPGVLIMVYRTKPFFNQFAVHAILMVVLAYTNGCLGTTAAMYLPKNVKTTAEKSLTGSWGLASTFWGVVIGQWSSKLIKVLLEPKA